MKRQKHYTEEREILADIDKANAAITRLSVEADTLDSVADNLVEKARHNPANAWFFEEARSQRNKARDKRKQAMRLRETRLVKLAHTLAAFRTLPLPGMEPLPVVLERK